MLVNGPIAQTVEINSGEDLFGPGRRANAMIGPAVRLVMRNGIGTLLKMGNMIWPEDDKGCESTASGPGKRIIRLLQ